MAVTTVKSELNVPKEFREVVDFLQAILKDVKAGKKAPTILAGNLKFLYKAVEGWEQLGDEVKSAYLPDAAAYLVQSVMSQLKPAIEVAPAVKGLAPVTKKAAKKAPIKVDAKAIKKVTRKVTKKSRK